MISVPRHKSLYQSLLCRQLSIVWSTLDTKQFHNISAISPTPFFRSVANTIGGNWMDIRVTKQFYEIKFTMKAYERELDNNKTKWNTEFWFDPNQYTRLD
jgi:hypothetical protein